MTHNNPDYITSEDERRIGVAYDLLLEAAGVLCDLAQFMGAVKAELVESNSWSEWDQQLRDRITAILTKMPDARK
jgi:hypothetical protein